PSWLRHALDSPPINNTEPIRHFSRCDSWLRHERESRGRAALAADAGEIDARPGAAAAFVASAPDPHRSTCDRGGSGRGDATAQEIVEIERARARTGAGEGDRAARRVR